MLTLQGLGGECASNGCVLLWGGGLRFAVSWRRITPDAFVWRALGASPICHFSKSLLSHVYQNSLCVLATVKQRSLPLLSMTLICFVLVSHWTCSGLYGLPASGR